MLCISTREREGLKLTVNCNLRRLDRSKKNIEKSSLSAKQSAPEKSIHLCESYRIYNRFIIQILSLTDINWPQWRKLNSYHSTILQTKLTQSVINQQKASGFRLVYSLVNTILKVLAQLQMLYGDILNIELYATATDPSLLSLISQATIVIWRPAI